MGEQGVRSALTGLLADALGARGELEEAEALASFTAEAAADADLVPQALWRRARARVCSAQGDHEEAERLVREAVAVVAATDHLDFRADTLAALGDALAAGGDDSGAAGARQEARQLYGQKGNAVAARLLSVQLPS